MNKLFSIIFSAIFAVIFFNSCEKDNITVDKKELDGTVDKKEADLKQALGSNPDGWVMMLKASSSSETYVPVVLRFDTAANVVHSVSTYGTNINDTSTFLINRGPSGVILNFSSGSVISGLMRKGSLYSDLTDYMFNVIQVNQDTITLQGIRSGPAYKPEGGVIYKLFKKPESWNWADKEMKLNFRTPEDKKYMQKIGRMTLNYAGENVTRYFSVTLYPSFDGNLNLWQTVDPFYTNLSARVFEPYYIYYFGIYEVDAAGSPITTTVFYVPFQAHNSLSVTAFNGNGNTVANGGFNTLLKTNYLTFNNVVKSADQLSFDVAAYDKAGKEHISGKIQF